MGIQPSKDKMGTYANYDVVIIGAGFSGVFIALELSKFYKILLVDVNETVIGETSSSYNECFKLHLGLHYLADEETAVMCLLNSLKFGRKFNKFILGQSKSNAEKQTHPGARGRHNIMTNSLYPPEKARITANRLKKTYEEKIMEDKQNKVFGEVDSFIKIIDSEKNGYIAKSIAYSKNRVDYSRELIEYIPGEHSETISVAICFETGETQIDIERFKAYLQKQIDDNPNITFLGKKRVTRVTFASGTFDYVVEALNDKNDKEVYRARSVASCAWQNNELLNKNLGHMPSNFLVRVKVSILVKLPESLRDKNTCICSVGPYFSFTNMENGTAIVTEEQYTNIGSYKGGHQPPQHILSLISNTPQAKQRLEQHGREILRAATKYMPALVDAEFIEARVGYVKQTNIDEVDLYSKESPHHQRREKGVTVDGMGFITCSGIKMTYTQDSAERASRLVQMHFAKRNYLEEVVKLAKSIILKDDRSRFNTEWKQSLLDTSLHDYARRVLFYQAEFSSVCDGENEKAIRKYAKLLAEIVSEGLKTTAKIAHAAKDACFERKHADSKQVYPANRTGMFASNPYFEQTQASSADEAAISRSFCGCTCVIL